MEKTFKQIDARKVNPDKSGWYNTDKGILHWLAVWTSDEDCIFEEYPQFWYEPIGDYIKKLQARVDILTVAMEEIHPRVKEKVKNKFVVRFENGSEYFWLSDIPGDPGRTILSGNSKKFNSIKSAERALEKAKKDFPHRRLDGIVYAA